MSHAEDYGVESVLAVLTETYGLTGRVQSDEFHLLCVNPKHDDTSPSCSVNLVTGYWHCHSCGVGGDLADLGHYVLGKTTKDVVGLLRPSTPEAAVVALQRRLGRISYAPVRRKRAPKLPEYEPLHSHPELRKRLFSRYMIDKWGLAWVPEQSFTGSKGEYNITNSIGIPIMSDEGKTIAWCYRRTEASAPWQPRYLYTPEFPISEHWFGMQHYANRRSITVVEGALDSIWNDQCGYPAIGLLGATMGDHKIAWLENYVDGVWLFPDLDNAGARWQSRISERIGQRVPVWLCQYRPWMMKKTAEPDGSWRRAKDPEEVRPVDVEIMHESAIPLSAQLFAHSRVN